MAVSMAASSLIVTLDFIAQIVLVSPTYAHSEKMLIEVPRSIDAG